MKRFANPGARRLRAPQMFAVLAAAIVLAAAAAAETSASASPDRTCHSCGRPIEGTAYEVGGVYYHPQHLRCSRCDAPMSGHLVVAQGRPYHEACYRNHVAPRCAICGEALTDRYVEQDSKRYHHACWEERVALKCSLCGGLIQGRYLQDGWGNRYHPEHKSEAPACEYCGRFISREVTQGGVQYGDGRHVCALCRRRAVDEPPEGRRLMAEVAADLSAVGLNVDVSGVRLHLVDRDSMRSLRKDASTSRTGYTDYRVTEAPDGSRTNESIRVYVLAGMPLEHAIATLAHELTHVWLYAQGIHGLSDPLAEGSCNYASALVLAKHPGRESDLLVSRMMEADDPAYGEGLRRVRRYAERKGIRSWISLLRTATDLPAGF